MTSFKLTVPFDLGRGLARIQKIKDFFTTLSNAFDETTGHTHGAAGEGAPIPAAGLAADAVTTAKIANANVTKAKAKVFVSTEQTGTGAAQNIAHGLGAVPAAVLVVPTEHPGTPDTGAFDIAEGAHDATNVVVTVTADVKFKVFAWA